MFHNHLSVCCKPSESDINITRNVSKVGKILEIQLVDHIIITDHLEGYGLAIILEVDEFEVIQ